MARKLLLSGVALILVAGIGSLIAVRHDPAALLESRDDSKLSVLVLQLEEAAGARAQAECLRALTACIRRSRPSLPLPADKLEACQAIVAAMLGSADKAARLAALEFLPHTSVRFLPDPQALLHPLKQNDREERLAAVALLMEWRRYRNLATGPTPDARQLTAQLESLAMDNGAPAEIRAQALLILHACTAPGEGASLWSGARTLQEVIPRLFQFSGGQGRFAARPIQLAAGAWPPAPPSYEVWREGTRDICDCDRREELLTLLLRDLPLTVEFRKDATIVLVPAAGEGD